MKPEPNDWLTPSESESARFGFRVFRATLADLPSPRLVQAAIFQARADLVILRIPANHLGHLSTLEQTGFPFLVADTLVYCSAPLDAASPSRLRNADLEFTKVSTAELPILDRLIEGSFGNYRNHYDANPLLSRADFLAGYSEWARSFASSTDGSKSAWLVRRSGTPVAFLTGSEAEGEATTVLGGVVPQEAGKGIYTDLIRFSKRHYAERGCNTMTVSTQVDNVAVQKVWAREGFSLARAVSTIHINAFLTQSVVRATEEFLSPTAGLIDAASSMSFDCALLRNSANVRSCIGLEGRLARRLLALAQEAGHIDTTGLRESTISISSRSLCLAPLFLGQQYTLRCSFPFVDQARGLFRAVAQLTGPAGELSAIAYCDFKPVD